MCACHGDTIRYVWYISRSACTSDHSAAHGTQGAICAIYTVRMRTVHRYSLSDTNLLQQLPPYQQPKKKEEKKVETVSAWPQALAGADTHTREKRHQLSVRSIRLARTAIGAGGRGMMGVPSQHTRAVMFEHRASETQCWTTHSPVRDDTGYCRWTRARPLSARPADGSAPHCGGLQENAVSVPHPSIRLRWARVCAAISCMIEGECVATSATAGKFRRMSATADHSRAKRSG